MLRTNGCFAGVHQVRTKHTRPPHTQSHPVILSQQGPCSKSSTLKLLVMSCFRSGPGLSEWTCLPHQMLRKTKNEKVRNTCRKQQKVTETRKPINATIQCAYTASVGSKQPFRLHNQMNSALIHVHLVRNSTRAKRQRRFDLRHSKIWKRHVVCSIQRHTC